MRRGTVAIVVLLGAAIPVGLAVLLALRSPSEDSGSGREEATVDAVPEEVLGSYGQTVTWTGDRLFAYGGSRADAATSREGFPYLNTAVLVEPRSGRSEILPEPPVDRALYPATAAAVPGQTVLLAGIECREKRYGEDACTPATFTALELDIETRTWSRIELPPGHGHGDSTRSLLGFAGNGTAVFRLGSDQAPDYWSYDRDRRTWRDLADPGVRVDADCLTGTTLVVATASFRHRGEILADDPLRLEEAGELVRYGPDDGYTDPRIAVLDLAGSGERWSTSAPAPDFLLPLEADGLQLSCTAGTAAVHDAGSQMRLHSVDPAQLDAPWTALPDPDPYLYTEVLAGDGVFVLVSGTPEPTSPVRFPSRSYNLQTGVWTSEPGLPAASPALTLADDRVIGFADVPGGGPALIDRELRGVRS